MADTALGGTPIAPGPAAIAQAAQLGRPTLVRIVVKPAKSESTLG
jgi:hypothetical protein